MRNTESLSCIKTLPAEVLKFKIKKIIINSPILIFKQVIKVSNAIFYACKDDCYFVKVVFF